MCLAAIYWARIPRVYYAASSDDARHAGFDDGAIAEYLCHDRAIDGPTLTRIPHPDASAALQHWANNPRRQSY
jgi:tRNA(Arg) A34 adenosine deaminase TadA